MHSNAWQAFVKKPHIRPAESFARHLVEGAILQQQFCVQIARGAGDQGKRNMKTIAGPILNAGSMLNEESGSAARSSACGLLLGLASDMQMWAVSAVLRSISGHKLSWLHNKLPACTSFRNDTGQSAGRAPVWCKHHRHVTV